MCWLGGLDKYRVLFVVMVKRVTDMPDINPTCRRSRWKHARATRRSTNAPSRAGAASHEGQRRRAQKSPVYREEVGCSSRADETMACVSEPRLFASRMKKPASLRNGRAGERASIAWSNERESFFWRMQVIPTSRLLPNYSGGKSFQMEAALRPTPTGGTERCAAFGQARQARRN